MKNIFAKVIAIRPSVLLLGLTFLLVIPLLTANRVYAQSGNASTAASRELHDKIAALDNAFFEAYNKCDLAKIEAFFTEDLEFYHEKSGLMVGRKSVMEVMKKNLCGDSSNRVRRELVQGSLEVRPINNYGAVQTGEHRFYLTQKDRKERLDGIGKFVNLWQNKDGEWRISRVFSYGFRPGE